VQIKAELLMRVSQALAARTLILVVEESHNLRPLVARALLHAGYHVLTAADLAQAIALLNNLHLHPALAIVDLHTSMVSSMEVAQALSGCQAEVPIIFVARYLDDPDAVLPGLILEKPFSFGTLCRMVENVLTRGAPLFAEFSEDPAW
jgi:DNA-binding response OmpR family regulator